MNTPEYPAKDIRFLIGLGAVGVLMLFMLPLIGATYVVREAARFEHCEYRSASDAGCETGAMWGLFKRIKSAADREISAYEANSSSLGDEGSMCGGEDRFPCKPGLSCVKEDGSDIGFCETVEGPAPKQTHETRNAGEVCGEMLGMCGPNLVCKLSPKPGSASSAYGNGVCIKADDAAPRIASMRLQGLGYDQDRYTGASGDKVDASVQAVNAASVQGFLRPSDGGEAQRLTEFAKAKGGVYTMTFSVPRRFSGELEIQAVDAHGQVASMSVKLLIQPH